MEDFCIKFSRSTIKTSFYCARLTKFFVILQINCVIMDFLPKDPAILVSSVNMLLRDEEFDTLEALCFAFSRDPKDIKDYLYKRGFVWSEQQKQFRPIGYDQ